MVVLLLHSQVSNHGRSKRSIRQSYLHYSNRLRSQRKRHRLLRNRRIIGRRPQVVWKRRRTQYRHASSISTQNHPRPRQLRATGRRRSNWSSSWRIRSSTCKRRGQSLRKLWLWSSGLRWRRGYSNRRRYRTRTSISKRMWDDCKNRLNVSCEELNLWTQLRRGKSWSSTGSAGSKSLRMSYKRGTRQSRD